MGLKKHILDALICLTLQEKVHQNFYLAVHAIAYLQSLSVIAQTSTTLHELTSWSDPSSYVSPETLLSLGLALILLFSLLFMGVCSKSDNFKSTKYSLFFRYLETIFLYIATMCQTIVLAPLVKSSILVIQKSSNIVYLLLAVVTLVVYLSAVFPIGLYISSNTSILTTPLDRKIAVLNSALVLNIFRVIFTGTKAIGSAVHLISLALYVLCFGLVTARNPIISYRNNILYQFITSSTAFFSIIYFSTGALGMVEGSVMIQLVGAVCFCCAIRILTKNRISKALQSQETSVLQIKALLFMAVNLQDFPQKLDFFLIKHTKICKDLVCKCRQWVRQLLEQESPEKREKMWFQFIVSYITTSFDLDHIAQMPRSQMIIQLQKYRQLIFDLAEACLFRLEKPYEAYLVLSRFRVFLEERELGDLWEERKFKKMCYYIEENLAQRLKTDSISFYPTQYRSFQTQIGIYYSLLLSTAEIIRDFWIQLGNAEPQESRLLKLIIDIGQEQQKIYDKFRDIAQVNQVSQPVLEVFTNDFFELVLSVTSGEPFHVSSGCEQQFLSRKKENVFQLSEDQEAFSQNSLTPLFFISIEDKQFGKIISGNRTFEEARHSWLGGVGSLEEMVVPELRQHHNIAIKRRVEADVLSFGHMIECLYTQNQCLVACSPLVQLIPTLSDGLRFAVYLKMIKFEKILVVLSSLKKIAYSSESFERLVDDNLTETLLRADISQLNEGNSMNLQLLGEYISLYCLKRTDKASQSLVFLELILGETVSEEIGESSALQLKQSSSSLHFCHTEPILIQKPLIEAEEYQQQHYQQQKERKDLTRINNAYCILFQKSKGKKNSLIYSMFIIIIGFCAVLCFISAILVKKSHENNYISGFDANYDYYRLMEEVAWSAVRLKELNLNNFRNFQSPTTFDNFLNSPNLVTLMDNLFANYNNADFSRDVGTLTLLSNKTWILGSEKNYMALVDFLSLPQANLKQHSLSELNFPFSLEYSSGPLSSSERNFHTYVTNALYFVFPSFKSLNNQVFSAKNEERLKVKLEIPFLTSIIILLLIILMIAITLISRKIMRINRNAHSFLESLSPEIIRSKIQSTTTFINKYSLKKPKTQTISLKQSNVGIRQHHQFQPQITTNNCPSSIPDYLMVDQQCPNESPPPSAISRRKTELIFTEPSYINLFIKRLILISPIIVCSILLVVQESNESQKLLVLLRAQVYALRSRLIILIIYLYSLHYGVYTEILEKYQSIPKLLLAYIYEMLQVMQYKLSTEIETFSPIYQKTIYGNICQLDSEGLFSDTLHNFQGRFNTTYCQSIEHAILTKGFSPTLMYFLGGATNLISDNPNTLNYSSAQRLHYLQHSFFRETSPLVDYLFITLQAFYSDIREKYLSTIIGSTFFFECMCIVIIVIIILVVIIRRNNYSKQLKREINDIRIIYLLISKRTILEEPTLKANFLEQVPDIPGLK